MRRAVAIAAALAGLTGAAHADDAAPPAPPRFSIGGGGSLLLTGLDDAGRWRADGHLGFSPGGRFGRFGLVGALRHLAYDPGDEANGDPVAEDGLATLGVRYEAAAARPRLAVALHGDLGFAMWPFAPAVGGGIETHLWLIPKYVRPLALVLDVTAHLVIDGVDDTRLVIGSATRLSLAW